MNMRNSTSFDVLHAINGQYDKLYSRQDELSKAHVCLICDEFIKPNELVKITVETIQNCSELLIPELWNSVSDELAKCYKYKGNIGNYNDTVSENTSIDRMMLSPRADYLSSSDLRTTSGFSCCKGCDSTLKKGKMPKYAIVNNYAFGSPPQCLLDLTEVEIALLTPVKTYGYCFSYTGGRQKQLKGSLAYFKVDIQSAARSVMHLDVLGLNRNIVVLMYGKMTLAQQARAKERSKVRTDYVLKALEWLTVNNDEWVRNGVNLNEIRQQLVNPLVLDNSIAVDDSNCNNNIETTESFQVYFPDGTMSQVTGGQENLEKFNELLQAATRNGYDIGFKSNLMKEAVSDFRDNNLVNACLLQFPYGRGGMHEQRINESEAFGCNTDIDEYVQHLSRISQPHFHHELFTLILYNLSMKQAMVRNAGWKVRNKCDAKALAEELTITDVTEAISTKVRGGRKRNNEGSNLLNAIDAISKAVPHTNEAAKAARSKGECLQHHFGTPSLFLTVTPDDDNSFLVQVFSNNIIDGTAEVSSLSDEELIAKARQRTELRINYPGICALAFEYMLDIVIEEVIGWDQKEGKPRADKTGLFGIPQAFTITVEEQGRRTLHTHIQVWLEDINSKRELLHCKSRHIVRSAEREITKFVDKVSKGAMFFNDNEMPTRPSSVAKAFPHECTVKHYNRRIPVVVDDQSLRNLRQKEGTQESEAILAFCPHCSYGWTSDELVESYLMFGTKIDGLICFPDNEVRRLKAMAIEYQKQYGVDGQMRSCIIDAAYNHHSHTKSCFERNASKKSNDTRNKSGKEDCKECRYRYPQRMHPKTVIQNASLEPVSWYNWDGSKTDRYIKEVCVERGQLDGFQNVCCPAISYSKLTCNTNITAVMPGPIGQYSFKYNLKGTQQEDSKEYGNVKDAMQKILSKIRTYQSDRSEAVKRLLSASFAHQKTNVVGAAMASYLTRKKSRFQFSHKMAWCPLRDIQSLVEGGAANVLISENNKVPFFQCSALHYLSRPSELEETSAFKFYSDYEVVRVTKRNREKLLQFSTDHFFKHPSYRAKTDSFLQGVRERVEPHLLKVFQYEFPDTAEFGGSILCDNTVINLAMEEYSRLVLLLFLPFREKSNLTLDDSFTLRLRKVAAEGHYIGVKEIQFLQNLQDTRSNSFRISKLEDDLQRRTQLQHCDGEECNDDLEEEGDESSDGCIELILQALREENDNGDNKVGDDSTDLKPPAAITFDPLRGKGSDKCGYRDLTGMSIGATGFVESVVSVEDERDSTAHHNLVIPEVAQGTESQRIPTQHDIVTVLLTKTRKRRRSFGEITNNTTPVKVLEANGSTKSIIDWARKAKLDSGQRRAFEIMASTFILSFYADIRIGSDRIFGDRHTFVKEHKSLKKLSDSEKRGSLQLIMLLHGPGGSGKTTVIDLLRTYAEEFCSKLEDFEYNPRTIMVTAMTGVAATILLGETTHSAVYLNQKKPLEAEQVEAWSGTRLLIIDEISFASKDDFKELHKKLRRLKQQLHMRYGGLNIVFSGDMRQLEPVGAGKNPVYTDDCPEFKDWVNCYIELNGMHRFKHDMNWGKLLRRFRNGTMTKDDIRRVNERVVNKETVIPNDIRYATYFNRDRDSINTALFEERCREMFEKKGSLNDSLLVFSDNIFIETGRKNYVRMRNCQTFWENCGEDSLKLNQGQGRMDPLLKVYNGCRLMLTRNTAVREGQANGTQAILEKIVLKHGETASKVTTSRNLQIPAVMASQVSHFVLRHANNRIQPPTFKVYPKKKTFKAKLLKPRSMQVKGNDRETVKMKATQLPVVVNNATTGHKLQGSGVDCLFVHNWSYVTNWVYVVLSRVRTHDGLYCRKPISDDLRKYAVPEALKKMMRGFSNRLPTFWTEEEYQELFDV